MFCIYVVHVFKCGVNFYLCYPYYLQRTAPYMLHIKLLYEFLCECGCFYWCCVCHNTISFFPSPPHAKSSHRVYKLKVTFNRRLEFIWCVWANQFVEFVFVCVCLEEVGWHGIKYIIYSHIWQKFCHNIRCVMYYGDFGLGEQIDVLQKEFYLCPFWCAYDANDDDGVDVVNVVNVSVYYIPYLVLYI